MGAQKRRISHKAPWKSSRRLKKATIASFSALLLTFYLWLAQQIIAVQLPDAGHPTLLYSTEMKDDLGQTFGAAIANAKESVLLTIYTLTDRKIIDKLNAKWQEGIPTTVICDAKACPEIEQKLKSGITLVKRFLPGLMHQKILIIDNKQIWIGSANMTSESLHHHGNLVTAIESEPLAAMATAKANSLTAYQRTALFPHGSFPVGGQMVEMWFLPDNSQAIARIKQLIQSAEKTIRIGMFTWTRSDLAREVIAAKQRGVAVEVVIDKGTAMGASEKIVKMLKKHKVPIRVNKGSALLHHKFLYVDQKTLLNGSANWTLAAFEKNDDCFMILNDLNADQVAYLESMWQTIRSSSSPPH